MSMNENGIGSNYRTLDNNPISPFHDKRISVELFPGEDGKYFAAISCDDLDYESGLRAFGTEQAAKLFARQTSEKLTQALDSQEKLTECVLIRILSTLEC